MIDKTISDREAEQLRKKIEFINRDGGYRTVITDSESADGILPRCASPAHPEADREQQWDVLDCCLTEDGFRLIETGHEHIASVWVDSLYVIPTLLDERDALRARVAELEQPAAEQDGDVRAVAALLRVWSTERIGAGRYDPLTSVAEHLEARFADRIAALDARDAKAER